MSGVDVTPYGDGFFDALTVESRDAAAVVVPLLLELFPSRPILDVCCGEGPWLSAFVANGVEQVAGVDGEYVDRRRLLIPRDLFHAHGLSSPIDLGQRFDLVLCLEVAGHLPSESGDGLVETLTRNGDIVIFSAAVPGQGGTHHANEQWPSYWRERFAAHGFEAFDILRPRLWDERRVGSWFRQNMLVFASSSAADRVSAIRSVEPPLDLVHPEQFTQRNEVLLRTPTIRASLRNLRAAVGKRVLRQLGRG